MTTSADAVSTFPPAVDAIASTAPTKTTACTENPTPAASIPPERRTHLGKHPLDHGECPDPHCQNAVQSAIRGLWLRAARPDQNLGRWAVGPSPQQVTHGTASRLLAMLELTPQDRFIDLGSGKGLVMALALARYKCVVFGVELDATAVGWAYRHIQELAIFPRAYLRDRWWELHSDIAADRRNNFMVFSRLTAAYSFDKDFPRPLLDNIETQLHHSGVRAFVSSRPPGAWHLGHLEWTGRREKGAIVGSGERHTFYLYRVKQCGRCPACRIFETSLHPPSLIG